VRAAPIQQEPPNLLTTPPAFHTPTFSFLLIDPLGGLASTRRPRRPAEAEGSSDVAVVVLRRYWTVVDPGRCSIAPLSMRKSNAISASSSPSSALRVRNSLKASSRKMPWVGCEPSASMP